MTQYLLLDIFFSSKVAPHICPHRAVPLLLLGALHGVGVGHGGGQEALGLRQRVRQRHPRAGAGAVVLQDCVLGGSRRQEIRVTKKK